MDPVSIEIPELREHLAEYLLKSQTPLTITNHGNTIGYFIPAPRKRTEAERAALDESAARLREELAALGVTEDELVEDFKRLRAANRK
jgi:antitoxin (DNA-binding transcriptional repressor) of toxin-antitoxin stability system